MQNGCSVFSDFFWKFSTTISSTKKYLAQSNLAVANTFWLPFAWKSPYCCIFCAALNLIWICTNIILSLFTHSPLRTGQLSKKPNWLNQLWILFSQLSKWKLFHWRNLKFLRESPKTSKYPPILGNFPHFFFSLCLTCHLLQLPACSFPHFGEFLQNVSHRSKKATSWSWE